MTAAAASAAVSAVLRDALREVLLAELAARFRRAHRALADAHPAEFDRLVLAAGATS